MQMAVSVTVDGVQFDVEGEYTPYTPARIAADPDDSYPAEGGTLEDVKVRIGGQDVGRVLSNLVWNAVIEAAEAEAGGQA